MAKDDQRSKEKTMTIFFNGEKKLNLTAPNNIIMDFFKTIAIEDNSMETKFINYILSNVLNYVKSKWSDKTLIRTVARLRREQFVAIKAGLKELPVIPDSNDDTTISISNTEMKAARKKPVQQTSSSKFSAQSSQKSSKFVDLLQKMVAGHIIWRIKTNNISQITALLMRMIVEHGLNEGHLRIAVYDDVPKQLHDWRIKKFIKLYTFGNLAGEDQKLLLASTNHGDLMSVIANCLDGSERKENSQLLKRLAHALRDKTMNIIYITHDLVEAMSCIEVTDLRCAILLNRTNEYANIASHKGITSFSITAHVT